MALQYQDKIAIVTGASSGIGEATARELAQRGATVVLVARRAGRLDELAESIRQDGGTAHPMPCDLRDDKAIRELVKNVDETFGRCDVLVNSAGEMAWAPLPVLRLKEDVKELLELNVASPWFLIRSLVLSMPKGSSVVNVASAAGVRAANSMSSYSASKGALIAMSRSLALELAPRKIRVNAVAPGVVETEAVKLKLNVMSDKQREIMQREHPLGLGQPQDVANAIAFLGSDEARWITGHTLIVDGGLTA